MKKMIKCGAAEGIVDSKGGELISFKLDGRDIMWTGDEKYWAGHGPVLFPTVGATRNGTVRFGGKEYPLAKHGFARKREFSTVEIVGNTAVFELLSDDETRSVYPYEFRLTITHTLNEKGWRTTYSVENRDEREIVFGIGGHPGFCVDSVDNYKLIFENEESCPLYYTDPQTVCDRSLTLDKRFDGNELSLCYGDFDHDAFIAFDLSSRVVKLVRRDDGHGVKLDFNGFSVLGVWTPPMKNAPFICLEPWNGCPAFNDETGDFEDKPYIVKLAPGSEYEVGYTVEII